jgi:hypothetical protein
MRRGRESSGLEFVSGSEFESESESLILRVACVCGSRSETREAAHRRSLPVKARESLQGGTS